MKSIFHLAFGALFLASILSSCGGGKPTDGTDIKKDSIGANNLVQAGISKNFTVDTTASVLNWIGTKVGGRHQGTIKLKSGWLKVEGGKLVGGSFVINMPSITVMDLEGEEKMKLEGHLKHADFFEVDKYTEGKFDITKVEGDQIEGNLTLKDKTNSIRFAARVQADGGGLTAEASAFMINRQLWGVNYESKFKDAPISDEISIAIKLVAR